MEKQGSVSWDVFYSAVQSQKAVSADSDFWLCIIVMCSSGYVNMVNCDIIHFRIVYLTLLNCRFQNRLVRLYRFSL